MIGFKGGFAGELDGRGIEAWSFVEYTLQKAHWTDVSIFSSHIDC